MTALDHLRSTLREGVLYCSGIYELPAEEFDLFYHKKNPKFLSLCQTSENPQALDELQSACEPAMFGRNNQTILDESYRKAGKMDTSDFVLRFDAQRTGLVDVVRSSLLAGEQSRRAITVELYKLNVYGEGAFFKPHQDTPRSGYMFGSLVVVFPTPHSGRALVLRHHDKEYTFDSGKMLANTPNSIGYVAFFSDVEHEVLPVVSGHRVTITYNLYWDYEDASMPDGVHILQPESSSTTQVQSALAALLDDPDVLPRGGMLGFGLRHAYPFPRKWDWIWKSKNRKEPDPLAAVQARLKGSDAALFEACEALGLDPKLRFVVKQEYSTILLDQIVDTSLGEIGVDDTLLALLENGIVIAEVSAEGDPLEEADSGTTGVHWVTEMNQLNTVESTFISYGNEAILTHAYLKACLVVEVNSAEDRKRH